MCECLPVGFMLASRMCLQYGFFLLNHFMHTFHEDVREDMGRKHCRKLNLVFSFPKKGK